MPKNGFKYGFNRFVLAILASLPLNNLGFSQEVLIDRLVAEVNGMSVIHSEVMNKVRKGNLEEIAAFPAKEGDPPYIIALQDLINQKLMLRHAEDQNIVVNDERVEGFITDMLNRRGLSMVQLKQSLANENITYEEYFEDSRKSLILKQFQGRFIFPFVKISEKDLESFYFKLMGSSAAGLKVLLRKIVVDLSGDTQVVRDAKNEHLRQIFQKLELKMPFDEAAKLYSNDESREKGGLMPLLQVSDLAPIMRQSIEGLGEGEFSKPVRVGDTAYIFYLESKTVADTDDFNRKRQQLEHRLKEIELRRETLKWIENERRRSKIRIVEN